MKKKTIILFGMIMIILLLPSNVIAEEEVDVPVIVKNYDSDFQDFVDNLPDPISYEDYLLQEIEAREPQLIETDLRFRERDAEGNLIIDELPVMYVDISPSVEERYKTQYAWSFDGIYHTSMTVGGSIAWIGSLFGWSEKTSWTKGVDKTFAEFAGGAFDAENWEENLCLKVFDKGDDNGMVFMGGLGSQDIANSRNGAYMSFEKVDTVRPPGEDSYNVYFVSWHAEAGREVDLPVSVRLYERNGYEVIDSKTIKLGNPWHVTKYINTTKDYTKACLYFDSDDLSRHFDFVSIDNNEYCQNVASI